uniref:RING-type domain-containing protein n=1 Tax=Caenorhabditis tropicalis TaxID=1561998 RepID=A0A1I7TA40_9PELO
MNSTSKQVISSNSCTMERTEDDLTGGLNKFELLDCGHFYCVNCAPQQIKEKHTNCFTSTSPSSAFTREISPQQIAEHDGELSQDGGERGNIRGSNRPSRRNMQNKTDGGRKRKSKKGPDQQLFYFLHLTKPVVVSLAADATYGDLLSRLHQVLGVDVKTHEIHIKTQKSSSEEGEGEYSTPGDPTPLEVVDSKTRLSDLRIPRQKMLILDVEPKKKRGSTEDKKESKKNEKENKGNQEDVHSRSRSRAEEPKSS